MKQVTMSVFAFVLMTIPAAANCYETIGCTNSDIFQKPDLEQMSCQTLWEVRNQIYHENGYCFRSSRALASFSNDNCTVETADAVKLNNYERTNIRMIVKIEKRKGC